MEETQDRLIKYRDEVSEGLKETKEDEKDKENKEDQVSEDEEYDKLDSVNSDEDNSGLSVFTNVSVAGLVIVSSLM